MVTSPEALRDALGWVPFTIQGSMVPLAGSGPLYSWYLQKDGFALEWAHQAHS